MKGRKKMKMYRMPPPPRSSWPLLRHPWVSTHTFAPPVGDWTMLKWILSHCSLCVYKYILSCIKLPVTVLIFSTHIQWKWVLSIGTVTGNFLQPFLSNKIEYIYRHIVHNMTISTLTFFLSNYRKQPFVFLWICWTVFICIWHKRFLVFIL